MSDQAAVLQTALLVLGSIVTAIIAAVGARKTIESRKRRRQDELPDDEREAVEAYATDPNQFVKLILNRLKEAEGKVDKLETRVEAMRKADRVYRIAIARWVRDIFAAWGVEDEMPLPAEEDRDILADVVPAALEATRPRIPKPREAQNERQQPRHAHQ